MTPDASPASYLSDVRHVARARAAMPGRGRGALCRHRQVKRRGQHLCLGRLALENRVGLDIDALFDFNEELRPHALRPEKGGVAQG